MNGPIAIFDSGVGGLTVLQALEEALPHENILYFADCAHFPYGIKSGTEILRNLTQITAFLFTQNCKLLVIGCHTVSVSVFNSLQKAFPLPMISMVGPTLTSLDYLPQKKTVALLGTEKTIESKHYQTLILEKYPNINLYSLACPLLAEKIEEGSSDTQPLIRQCIEPIIGKNIDALLLACTHYPHLQRAIEEELELDTIVMNPAPFVAGEVKELLKTPTDLDHTPHHTFFVTGNPSVFSRFLNQHPPKASYTVREILF